MLRVTPSLLGGSGLSAVVEEKTGRRWGRGGGGAGLPGSKCLCYPQAVRSSVAVSSFIIIDNNNSYPEGFLDIQMRICT